MDVFLLEEDWNAQYASPADYVSQHGCMNGDSFTLVKATVYTATSYTMIGGKPTPTTIHIGAELPAV